MPSVKLNHCNIWTRKLDDTVRFYELCVGLKIGERPPFRVPGAWLYDATGTPVLHLIDVENATPSELAEAGDRDPDKLGGSGSIDHIGFDADGLDEARTRLERAHVKYREARFPAIKLVQLFMLDPNGVQVEILFRDVADA